MKISQCAKIRLQCICGCSYGGLCYVQDHCRYYFDCIFCFPRSCCDAAGGQDEGARRLTLVVAIVFTVIVVALYVGQHADKTYENAFKDGLAKLEETINSEQSSSSGSDTSAAADTDAESGAGSASSESESASDSAQTAE